MKGTLKLRTASLAAAAVMAAGLFAALPAAAETSTPETAQEDSGVPYDVANGLENSFRYKDGVPIYDDSVPAIEWEDIVQQDAATYSSNGIATCSVTYNGFDVSYHQGTVDWDAVKNSGIDFVMIRCGIGSEYDGVGENKQDDAQWYRNVSECERLGIPYGVYLYSYAENTDMAASEARHTLSLLSGHNPTLPVFLDIEHTRDGNPIASNSTYGDIAQTWCNMVSNAGYRVGIYSYYYFFQNYLTDSRFSNSGWYKWMADYRSGVSYDGSSCNMWQYSNKGTVPGVNANVDLNYWFGEYPGNNNNYTGWRSESGRDYWYENGVKQGTTGRGKEIYDSGSNAWYWLDANQSGAKAVNKDVYQESNGGKWVRYDANGHMVKGWDTNNDGTYYFDQVYGTMAKGIVTIDGNLYLFDVDTGVMQASITTSEEAMADRVIELVNQERTSRGLQPLLKHDGLMVAAAARAKELSQRYSHTRPNGSECFTILWHLGIDYGYAGENIAMGQRTPEIVMNDWMNSSGHRANILSENFDYIGVGYTMVDGHPYWVQLFTGDFDL